MSKGWNNIARPMTLLQHRRSTSRLLSSCVPKTYTIARSLVALIKQGEKSYGKLVDLVAKHFTPTPSSITQSLKFNSRIRQNDESIASYVAL